MRRSSRIPAVVALSLFTGMALQAEQVQGQKNDLSRPQPKAFSTKEGKKGWKVAIPGKLMLATPAVADGKVLLGGGFGSHEFYAFDAATGKNLWVYKTGDDGPSAAVVDNGYIAFNTESCELEIITMDGKRVWKKWLGDPLMSMPALGGGKVYMAFPDSKKDNKHYLACFDVKTGTEAWRRPIAGGVITAPVLAGKHIYLATVDGSLYCLRRRDGGKVWQEVKNATSSPTVWNGRCYFSRRQEVLTQKDNKGRSLKQQTERLASRPVRPKGKIDDLKSTKVNADYLDATKRTKSKLEVAFQVADGKVGFGMMGGGLLAPVAGMSTYLGGNGVMGGMAMGGGFGGGMMGMGGGMMMGMGGGGGFGGSVLLGVASFGLMPPPGAYSIGPVIGGVLPVISHGMPQAMLGFGGFGQFGFGGGNLGQFSVSGLWSFQGSRPFFYRGRLFMSMGDTVKCIDPKTEKVLWQIKPHRDRNKDLLLDSVLTPPVPVNGKLFLGTSKGEIFCLAAVSGKLLWKATIGEPILFQPAIAHGRIYIPTIGGNLYCLETGDPNDHGWPMWGGGPGHNGGAE